MTRFQWVALPLLGLLVVIQLRAARRPPRRRRHLLAAALWLAAAATVANAHLTTWLALQFGIGRGADLVLYVAVLAGLATGVHFFGRIDRLESDVTRLVRAQAIADGLRRSGEDDRAAAAPGAMIDRT